MAGKVCRIQTPPSSCRLMANDRDSASTNTSAPTFTSSDTILLTWASSRGVASGRK